MSEGSCTVLVPNASDVSSRVDHYGFEYVVLGCAFGTGMDKRKGPLLPSVSTLIENILDFRWIVSLLDPLWLC